MVHNARMRPILAVCIALAVGVRAEICWPGEDCFWTKLSGLMITAGRLEPAFTPDNTAYTLHIPEESTTSVIFTLMLDLSRYNPVALPTLEVDDAAYTYDPLTTNTHTVRLAENIGPYDEVLRIQVADPKGPTGMLWFTNPRATTYSIRIMQAPEVNKVVKPINLTVVLQGSGEVLQASPPFDPQEPSRDAYVYVLPDTVVGLGGILDVQVQCSEFATEFKWNGVQAEMNATRGVAMSKAFTRVTAECKYSDTTWVPDESQAPFMLTFHQRLNLSSIKVSLRILSDMGYCAERPGSEDAPQPYFECRSAVSRPDVVALYSEARAEAYLVDTAGRRVQLPSGEVRSIGLPEHGARGNFTLEIHGDREPLRYRVVVIQAALCSTLQCPMGLYPRPGLQQQESVTQRLCAEATCGEADAERCCATQARCSTLAQCPDGKVLRKDAADAYCSTAACSLDADGAACCGEPTPCQAQPEICGADRVLRGDAAGLLYCRQALCGPSDVEVCCEARAPCTAFNLPCPGSDEPAATTPSPSSGNASHHFCRSAVCTAEDGSQCCDVDLAKLRAEEERRRQQEAMERARRQAAAARHAHFEAVGCYPDGGRTCSHQRCFYDETCRPQHPRFGGLGCWAGGVDLHCRFCGFKHYLPCPRNHSCFDGDCEHWTEEKLQFCFQTYRVDCPEIGRWAYEATVRAYEMPVPVLDELAGAHRRLARWVLFAAGTLAGLASLAMLRLCAGVPCGRSQTRGPGQASPETSSQGERLLVSTTVCAP